MAVITYGAAAPAAKAPAHGESLFMRFVNALAESRMRRAHREIARYRHLLPQELEAAAGKLGPRTEDELPFIR
ncbi:MAG TPA: hypothetical protein VEM36_04920 [Xanthobacteraceae bacterium]|nr:hypothetical protein [Xanthobacteraceae bacterium]